MSATDWVLSRSWLQPLFEKLHGLALAGMNYDRSWDVRSSGEIAVLRYVRRVATDKPLIVDVGANIGEYTEAALAVLGPRCRVHAVEPSAEAQRRLAARFAGHPQVRLHGCALGSVDRGVALLHQDHPGSATASLYGEESSSTQQVTVRTLDALCEELRIQRIDLLKIDTEGHELQVLQGSRSLLSRGAITAIQFELSGKTIDARAYFRDFWHLLQAQYDIYRVARSGPRRVPEYGPKLEVFLTINFLAVLRDVESDGDPPRGDSA